jgi:hypothetical protein
VCLDMGVPHARHCNGCMYVYPRVLAGVRSRLSGQLSLGAGVPAESPRRLSGRMSSGVVPMATGVSVYV